MKKIFALVTAMLFLASVSLAVMIIPANDNAKENAKAPENSPVIDDSWGLERVDFIHYKKNFAKPGKTASKPPACYKFIAPTKPKWKTLPVNYIINPTNPQNLGEGFVVSAVSTSAETWDAATSTELMNDTYTVDYTVKYGTQDYKNVISFGDYPEAGVIAVTSVWWNPVTKAIVEFDIMFDTDWTWGDATTANVMDLQNIATHELGHGVGLGDVYDSACSEVTMYGYSDYGETKKRTLEQPDITGLQVLYGA